MKLDDAIITRINEILKEKNLSLTTLCLNSNLTPSTVFDFMNKKSKYPKIITIKKLCCGANITLEEFFSRDYFNQNCLDMLFAPQLFLTL